MDVQGSHFNVTLAFVPVFHLNSAEGLNELHQPALNYFKCNANYKRTDAYVSCPQEHFSVILMKRTFQRLSQTSFVYLKVSFKCQLSTQWLQCSYIPYGH